MPIYVEYVGRDRDEFYTLEDLKKNYRVEYDESFNFAYDVVDRLGREKPDKLAMLWVGADGEEKYITFRDMSLRSNKVANYFKSLGISKGDAVMLVLRRSDLFWYCMMALHKIGAIAVQATDMLTASDYKYRCNAGGIKMAVITGHGDCTAHFDEGEPYDTIELKAVTMHKKAGEGWLDFEAGVEAASDVWERPTGQADTLATDTMLMSFSSGTTGYPKMITHDFTYPLTYFYRSLLA